MIGTKVHFKGRTTKKWGYNLAKSSAIVYAQDIENNEILINHKDGWIPNLGEVKIYNLSSIHYQKNDIKILKRYFWVSINELNI